jgi:hypothetical protein
MFFIKKHHFMPFPNALSPNEQITLWAKSQICFWLVPAGFNQKELIPKTIP